jgi:hypothetical protein
LSHTPGLGSPVPHVRRDWACPAHIRTGTGLTPPTSSPGLGPPLAHLHGNRAHPSQKRFAMLSDERRDKFDPCAHLKALGWSGNGPTMEWA